MGRRFFLATLMAFAMALTGCGDSVESIANDHNELMSEYLGILKSIHDDASAKEAAAKIEGLIDRQHLIATRVKNLLPPDKFEKSAALGIAVADEMARVLQAGFGPIINNAVTKFNRAGL